MSFGQPQNRFKAIDVVPLLTGQKVSDPEQDYWRSLGESTVVKELGSISHISFQTSKPHNWAVSASRRVKVYDSKTFDVTRTMTRFHDTVHCTNFRSDNKLLVSATADKEIKLFTDETRTPLRIWKGHQKDVRFADFYRNASQIYSCSDDQTVRLWDIASESCITSFDNHSDYVRCGTTNSDGLIITGSYDNTVRLFDPRSNSNVLTMDHGDPVKSVVEFPGGLLLSAGGNVIKVWDLAHGGKLLYTMSNHHKDITCMTLNHNKTRLLSGGLDCHVKIYDIGTYQVVNDIKYPAAVTSMAISPDNDRLLVVGMVNCTTSVRQRKAASKGEGKSYSPNRRTSQQSLKNDPQSTSNIGDFVIYQKQRDQVEKYDKYFCKFEYSKAYDVAFKQWKDAPEKVAVLKELMRREALAQALAGQSNKELKVLLQFLDKHIKVAEVQDTLIEVGATLLDIYKDDYANFPESIKAIFKRLKRQVKVDNKVKETFMKLVGYVEKYHCQKEVEEFTQQQDMLPMPDQIPTSI